MHFRLEDIQYQRQAVQSVLGVFRGQTYTPDFGLMLKQRAQGRMDEK